jgi:lysophospholipase L1-like esterase
MQESGNPQRRFALYVSMYGITLLLLVVLAEGIARLAGYHGWTQARVEVEQEGQDRFFIPDTVYGYAVQPGHFQLTEKQQLRFTVTHDAAAHRITAPLSSPADSLPRPEIWIFGCSFTHGWGVNDDQTWPWKLQAALPAYRVVNFAVSGYSTLHSRMQLNTALSLTAPPALVVLAYAGFHDQRNTANRFWMKTLSTFDVLGEYGYPYVRRNQRQLTQRMKPIGYPATPGMHWSALMHLTDDLVNYTEDHFLDSHTVSTQLIQQMADASTRAGAGFVLAGITQDPMTRDMLVRFARQGFRTADIAVDLNDPAFSFLPLDPHPNATAHSSYAEGVAEAIRQQLD